jgi:plastocyanin
MVSAMRIHHLAFIVSCALGCTVSGCGSSNGSGVGGGTTTTTTTSAATGGGSTPDAGITPTNAAGCTAATAQDMTGETNVAVTFTTATLRYHPACIRISAGSSVTWTGDFTANPLQGGTVSKDGTLNPDATSPIVEHKTTGGGITSFTVQFPNTGRFPYFSELNGAVGMTGVVIVQQ